MQIPNLLSLFTRKVSTQNKPKETISSKNIELPVYIDDLELPENIAKSFGTPGSSNSIHSLALRHHFGGQFIILEHVEHDDVRMKIVFAGSAENQNTQSAANYYIHTNDPDMENHEIINIIPLDIDRSHAIVEAFYG